MRPKRGQADGLLNTAERRTFVLEKRRGGLTYQMIAAMAIKEFGEDRLPAGWDSRYAYKDVKRELEKAREMCNEAAKDVLALERDRLDVAQAAIWGGVLKGNLRAVDTYLRIHDRRCKLEGIAPEKHEVEAVVKIYRGFEDALGKGYGDDEQPSAS